MGFSRDFDRVTVTDATVVVEATSLDDNLKPSSDDPATMIYVTLVRLPEGTPLVTSSPEDMPVGASWSVTFADAGPQFADAEDVLCVGVAISDSEPPYVWNERRRVNTRTP